MNARAEDAPAPIEAKVRTGTITAAVGAFTLGLVQQYVFKGGAVPEFVTAFITSAVESIVVGGATFLVSYSTRHTPRIIRVEQDPTTPTPWSDNPTG